jgi:signal transduction histidine kinase
MKSLRWRFVIGSLLWTAGLLGLVHLLSMLAMVHLHRFDRPTSAVMVLIGVTLMAAGAWWVLRGLQPVVELRRRLGELREGRATQLEGEYPTELQPLVDDLNALLEHREKVVRRALAKAGDLAHGLKTPLALLAQEAEKAQAAGQEELAAAIGQQVEKMRRQVDYHLAQARAAAAGATLGARSELAPIGEGLARTLRRLYADRQIEIELALPPGLAVKVQREDLEEMLGNLLDNACKWSKSRIRLVAESAGDRVVVVVADDGPGLAEEDREKVLQRGVRADEAAPGTGLGLAIVRDLAELYGGRIELSQSHLGGLAARLELPPT